MAEKQARIARSVAREERIADLARRERDAAESAEELLERITKAKGQARVAAAEFARESCEHGTAQGSASFTAFAKQNSLTLSEVVMFRSLVEQEMEQIVRNAATPEAVRGLTPREALKSLGYNLIQFDESDWGWRKGTGITVSHSPTGFANEGDSILNAVKDFEETTGKVFLLSPEDRKSRKMRP